jgi:predicted dehydrogenase
MTALDPSPIRAVAARGGPGGDPVVVDVELASGFVAKVTLSRASPVKERRLRVVGSTASAVFDDVRAPDCLLVGGAEIRVPWREPLAVEIEHFLRCVEHRTRPRTPFDDGVTVVRALAQAEESRAHPQRRHASATDSERPMATTPQRT